VEGGPRPAGRAVVRPSLGAAEPVVIMSSPCVVGMSSGFVAASIARPPHTSDQCRRAVSARVCDHRLRRSSRTRSARADRLSAQRALGSGETSGSNSDANPICARQPTFPGRAGRFSGARSAPITGGVRSSSGESGPPSVHARRSPVSSARELLEKVACPARCPRRTVARVTGEARNVTADDAGFQSPRFRWPATAAASDRHRGRRGALRRRIGVTSRPPD